jgi:hypothetical protein
MTRIHEAMSEALKSEFFNIMKEAFSEVLDERNLCLPSADAETLQTLAVINSKPLITVAEAAMLLGCSDDHLYTRIREARKNKSRYPIPFRDLDGVLVLPREELLEWSAIPKEPKRKLRVA